MRVRGQYFVAAVVIFAGFGVEARASCPLSEERPPCMEFWLAEAVFIGRATRLELIQNNTQLAIGRTAVYFDVEEAFRGVDRSAIVFELTGATVIVIGTEQHQKEKYDFHLTVPK